MYKEEGKNAEFRIAVLSHLLHFFWEAVTFRTLVVMMNVEEFLSASELQFDIIILFCVMDGPSRMMIPDLLGFIYSLNSQDIEIETKMSLFCYVLCRCRQFNVIANEQKSLDNFQLLSTYIVVLFVCWKESNL